MATITKVVHISKALNNVTKLLTNLSVSSNVAPAVALGPHRRITPYHCAFVHTTPKRNELMEFFDDKKVWGENEVKVGRAWKVEELRIKSNDDLHKLWFVLLKERNMLLTMEHACDEAFELFPSPERQDKVRISMSNLEQVVRERNKAYHLLETGETGERPGKLVFSPLGLRYFYRMRQYTCPKYYNKKWAARHQFGYNGYAVRKFLSLYREKLWNAKRRERNRNRNHVIHLIRRFPNLDLEAVRQQYPDVDVDACKQHKKARGHFVPE